MRRFTVTTGHGWFWVTVHPTRDGMIWRARRGRPWESTAEDDLVLACFQPNPSRGSYAGIMRLCREHLSAEIVTHESVHAAVEMMRRSGPMSVGLGRVAGAREEELAYLVGEVATKVAAGLRHGV